MTIDSFFFNDVKYTGFTRDGNNVLYAVDAVQQGESITAKVYYHGSPPSGGFFAGVTHEHSDNWNKDVTWTLSESFAAKDWFPVKQDLQDKADSAWILLTTDTAYMAGSEGVLENVTELGNGKHRFEWKEHHPIDYYLLSFSVSDYQDYSIYAHPSGLNGDSVLIQNFIYDDPSCLQVNKNAIDETAGILELYSDLNNKQRDILYQKCRELSEFPKIYPVRLRRNFRELCFLL
jgi:aminopeptidase N